ncbi:glycine betaine ABC transporter substrate-binding protein [Allokutzneria sp. A3M-2-11 16]|uniref:glycine betaine ABC transporter substrate-binding protein n=1 Tax=Allokutzneria sp. A3M-2-11 16 TaxID=2962043 RepID=UPI0020B8AE1E|nr:glycine betaine ABC transporter substrate-binding protein [Allokutzneria sp. A3M-2-11 16]MCP3799553.1 glycine betaine ABC transporter substrate-binding protein [Allokutzneria sp. A3M-2-11 16]
MKKASLNKIAAVMTTAALLAGCGLSAGSSVPLDVKPGSIRPVPQLRNVEITVGSKDFSEQIVLGYLAEFALTAAGAKVRDLTNISGSNSQRDALTSGQIDLVWEYTGTSWISYLGNTDPIPDAAEQFEAVRKADLAKNKVIWVNMAPLDNTYAFAMTKKTAQRLGIRTMSDIGRLARENPAEATFCVETEYANRNDGFPGVQKTYGFTAPKGNVRTLATGAIYPAMTDSKICNFGEVFTTDGRILAQDLVLAEDDKKFFPRYNAALNLRKELYERHPEIADVLKPIADRLTNEVMIKLNAQVDVNGKDPADVARNWLVEQGFVTLTGPVVTRG